MTNRVIQRSREMIEEEGVGVWLEQSLNYVARKLKLGRGSEKWDKHGRSQWALYAREARYLAAHYDVTAQELADNAKIVQDHSPLEIHSILWFIPEFYNPSFGGIHTILRFAAGFARDFGVKNSFVIQGGDLPEISARMYRAFPELANSPVFRVGDVLPEADAGIATLWTTAFDLLRVNQVKRKFYFMQDFEPLFYPAGTSSGLVEATYRFGFYGIANTPTIRLIYERDYGGKATHFYPCVDAEVFHPEPRKDPQQKPYRLFLYARPGHPRNAFEMGGAVLRALKKRMGDQVQILCAGADWKLKDYRLEGVVENLGLLSYEQTGELYRSCDVGLVLMFTRHPSYLPFELMGCGSLVVTNYNPATTWFLRDGENCFLAEPTVNSLVDRLEFALTHPAERCQIAEKAAREMQKQYTDWDAQIRQVYQEICSMK